MRSGDMSGTLAQKGCVPRNKASFDQSSMLRGCSTHCSVPREDIEVQSRHIDEVILDVVKLVYVLHNGLTLILYKVMDKNISTDGNTKVNVAVNHKRHGRD